MTKMPSVDEIRTSIADARQKQLMDAAMLLLDDTDWYVANISYGAPEASIDIYTYEPFEKSIPQFETILNAVTPFVRQEYKWEWRLLAIRRVVWEQS